MTNNIMRSPKSVLVGAALGIILIILAVHPELVSFSANNVGDYISMMTPLFFIALFVERALEVFLTVWRGPGSEQLQLQLRQLKTQAKGELVRELQAKEGELQTFKSKTRNIAYASSVSVGLVISALGIRAIQMFLDADAFAEIPDLQRTLFQIADVIITGALIGGGSDGIHQIVSAVTTFMESTKNKAKE
jgi:hypothetical protein